MKSISFLVGVCCTVCLIGCGHQEVAKGPIQGTLHLDNLPPDQQIAKVQSDNSIPDRYKQLYINSVRAKQGQPPQATVPGN